VKRVVANQTKSNSVPLPNLLNQVKRVIYGHHTKEVVVLMGIYLGHTS
jgi:type IV secretory pathway VirB2 component (pilin)